VVNVSVVITVAVPGVTVVCENAPVASDGKLLTVRVTGFGNPPVPGVSWIMAVMAVPAGSGAGGVGTEIVKEIAVPDSETVCVVGDASSVIVKVAGPRAPAAVRVNVRLITQLAAGATVDAVVQVVPVVATEKSEALAPLITTPLMCSVEPPGLLTVIVEGPLVVPTA
jgi:hypothetical protein